MKTLLLAATLVLPTSLVGQSTPDSAGVRQAVLDYVEGFYEGDTTRLARGLLPQLNKYGYYIPRGDSVYTGEAMSYAEAIQYANGVKARNQPAPATAPKKIVIFDVQDQTASAKLTAWWGTDYLLLAKYNGQWKIVQVLWQSPPRRS
jgi:hypothetical protein